MRAPQTNSFWRTAFFAALTLAAGCSKSTTPLFPHLRANVPPEAVELPVAKIVPPSTLVATTNPDQLLVAWMGCLSPSWPAEEGREAPCALVARHVGFSTDQLRHDVFGAANAVEAAFRADLFRKHLDPLQRAPQLALFEKSTNAMAELRQATDAIARFRNGASGQAASYVAALEEAPIALEAAGQGRALRDLWAFANAPPSDGAPRASAKTLAWMIGLMRLQAAETAPPVVRLPLVEPALVTLLGYRAGQPTVFEPSARWFEYVNAAADTLAPSGWLNVPRYVSGQGDARQLAEVQAHDALRALFTAQLRDSAAKAENPELRRAGLAYAESRAGR